MKRFLSVITLAALAVPSVAVVAEMTGVPVSTAFSLEISLSVFVSAFALLLAVSEYSRRRAYVLKRPSDVLLPATEAFCGGETSLATGEPARRSSAIHCTSACV